MSISEILSSVVAMTLHDPNVHQDYACGGDLVVPLTQGVRFDVHGTGSLDHR